MQSFVRRCNSECNSLEAGYILLNTSADPNALENAEAMDQAIEDGMLEFLSDNFATLTAEDKATGGLLAQDEKKGVERLIEGMQLIPW